MPTTPPVNVKRLPCPHTLIRLRAELIMDRDDGSEFRDWEHAAQVSMKGLLTALKTSEELAGQERTDTFWEFRTSPTADILATDRMILPNGAHAEVVGVPFVWTNHRNIPHHTKLTLRWIEGG